MKHRYAVEPLTRLLLPIDGSEPSERAVTFAANLSAFIKDRIEHATILHIITGHYLSNHLGNVDLRAEIILEDKTVKRLKKHYIETEINPMTENARGKFSRIAPGVNIDSKVFEGDTAEIIANTADKGHYSTIIMGRRGRSLVTEVLLGSVTSRLLHMDNIGTVYIVGNKVLGNLSSQILLIPLDGSPHALSAIREAAILAKAGLGRIILLSVINIAYCAGRIEMGEDLRPESEEIVNEGKRLLLEAGTEPEKIFTSIRYGRPADVVLKTAEEKGSSLILMGRQGRSTIRDILLGSVSSEVIHRGVDPTIGIVTS